VYEVGKNLIVNGDNIYDEISTAIADYKASNWFGFGKNIGLALGKMLSVPASTHQLIAAHINADLNSTWKATTYPKFEGKSVGELKLYAGTILGDNAEKPSKFLAYTSEEVAALPATFDARTKWPNCVHGIMDQMDCGSCWAFGAAEAISDRFCISSAGEINVVFSP
jgi:hypothetical protein